MLPFAKAVIAKSVVGKLASDNDTKTTALGIVAASLIASQIDFGKLIAGDHNEIGKALGALIAGLLGYYTNKKNAQ